MRLYEDAIRHFVAPATENKNVRLHKIRFWFWLFVPENSRVILIYWLTCFGILWVWVGGWVGGGWDRDCSTRNC